MATFVCIALLAIMLILVTAESSALFHLHREVKFLERQQIKRLNASQTNLTARVALLSGEDPSQHDPIQSGDSK